MTKSNGNILLFYNALYIYGINSWVIINQRNGLATVGLFLLTSMTLV